MSRLLAQSPANLANAASGNAVFLTAQVSRARVGADDQIKILWNLENSRGETLGQVEQENKVPQGQLDGAWGEDAFFATQGARDGVMQLLQQAGAIG